MSFLLQDSIPFTNRPEKFSSLSFERLIALQQSKFNLKKTNKLTLNAIKVHNFYFPIWLKMNIFMSQSYNLN